MEAEKGGDQVHRNGFDRASGKDDQNVRGKPTNLALKQFDPISKRFKSLNEQQNDNNKTPQKASNYDRPSMVSSGHKSKSQDKRTSQLNKVSPTQERDSHNLAENHN